MLPAVPLDFGNSSALATVSSLYKSVLELISLNHFGTEFALDCSGVYKVQFTA